MPGEIAQLSGLLSGMDNPTPTTTTPAATATPPVTAPATQTPPATEPAPQQQQPTETTPPATQEPAKTPEQVFASSKQNAAFAQMRTENAKYRALASRLANVLGIQDVNDTEALVQNLNERILATEAQARNIPVDVLQRLDEAERYQQEHEQEQLKQQAFLGFQKVKDSYKLTDEKLQEFATKLMDAGVNPFTDTVDLIREYKNLYFDDIMKAEREAAIKEALERQTKAATHSTTPSTTVGTPAQTPKPITNIGELKSLIDGFK